HGGGVFQGIQQGNAFLTPRLFVVAQDSTLPESGEKTPARFTSPVEGGGHVPAQPPPPRGVPPHAYPSGIDVEKTPRWRGKKQPFLDAVKELPVAAFRFATVGDVF